MVILANPVKNVLFSIDIVPFLKLKCLYVAKTKTCKYFNF